MGIDGRDIKKKAKVKNSRSIRQTISTYIGIGILILFGVTLLFPVQEKTFLTASEFGEDWPFYVSEVEVWCKKNAPLVDVDGSTYALTGMGEVLFGYPLPDPVIKDSIDTPGVKYPIYPISRIAKKMCD